MKSTLEEIYFDSQGFIEKINEREEYDKISFKYDKVYGELHKSLNKEQKKMLDELDMLIGSMEAEAGLAHFKEGFKFCMRLVIEGLGK